MKCIFGVLLLCSIGSAAAQPIYLFIDSVTIIGKISGNKVFISESTVGYTLQGNTIFKGPTTDKQDILFTTDLRDPFSKRAGVVYQSDTKTAEYIALRNAVYLGDFPIDKNNDRLLTFDALNDSTFRVVSGIDSAELGIIKGRISTAAEFVVAAHLYISHYDLAGKLNSGQAVQRGEVDIPEGVATIRPLYDRGPYYEWEWDGHTLKPAWGYRPDDEWTFDGQYLKPAWNMDPQAEWIWDGKVLKPYWETTSQNQWIWDNDVLKPYWDSDPDKMWTLEDGIMRPMWNYTPELEWQVDGDIPLPVIALVVLGFADR